MSERTSPTSQGWPLIPPRPFTVFPRKDDNVAQRLWGGLALNPFALIER